MARLLYHFAACASALAMSPSQTPYTTSPDEHQHQPYASDCAPASPGGPSIALVLPGTPPAPSASSGGRRAAARSGSSPPTPNRPRETAQRTPPCTPFQAHNGSRASHYTPPPQPLASQGQVAAYYAGLRGDDALRALEENAKANETVDVTEFSAFQSASARAAKRGAEEKAPFVLDLRTMSGEMLLGREVELHERVRDVLTEAHETVLGRGGDQGPRGVRAFAREGRLYSVEEKLQQIRRDATMRHVVETLARGALMEEEVGVDAVVGADTDLQLDVGGAGTGSTGPRGEADVIEGGLAFQTTLTLNVVLGPAPVEIYFPAGQWVAPQWAGWPRVPPRQIPEKTLRLTAPSYVTGSEVLKNIYNHYSFAQGDAFAVTLVCRKTRTSRELVRELTAEGTGGGSSSSDAPPPPPGEAAKTQHFTLSDPATRHDVAYVNVEKVLLEVHTLKDIVASIQDCSDSAPASDTVTLQVVLTERPQRAHPREADGDWHLGFSSFALGVVPSASPAAAPGLRAAWLGEGSQRRPAGFVLPPPRRGVLAPDADRRPWTETADEEAWQADEEPWQALAASLGLEFGPEVATAATGEQDLMGPAAAAQEEPGTSGK